MRTLCLSRFCIEISLVFSTNRAGKTWLLAAACSTQFGLLAACRPHGAADDSLLLSAASRNMPADEDAIRPSPEGRRAILGRAASFGAWPSEERRARTILQGPSVVTYRNGELKRQKEREFAFNQVIECTYVDPWRMDKPGGKTAKFSCDYSYQTDSGKTKTKKLKVKYDDSKTPSVNTGIYAEPMTTRLLWTLGYYADIVIPVQVRCAGCPNEPWKHLSSYWAVIENEKRLAEAQPGTLDTDKLEKMIIGDSVRYVAETLSRYEAYRDVKMTGRDGDLRIVSATGEEIFSTSLGVLRVGGQRQPIFDPQTKRLLKVDLPGGATDFKINQLDPKALGGRLAEPRDFVSAVVEWKHNSIPIETYYHEGWAFNASSYEPERAPEIRLVDPPSPALSLARQELALLSVFLGHADNKAEQQRLVCLDRDKIEAEDEDCKELGDPRWPTCEPSTDVKFETCEAPALMLQDVGFTLGYGTRILGADESGRLLADSSPQARAFGTADAKGFLEAPIFKDEAQCITAVNEWVTGAEIEERITEPARLGLVEKLRSLAGNEQDLSDLFRLGRLHLKKLHFDGRPMPSLGASGAAAGGFAGGAVEETLVDEFKAAFRAKVERLAAMHCPPA